MQPKQDLSDLLVTLQNLDFLTNFKAFSVDVSIDAGDEAEILNKLRINGRLVKPALRLIVRETGDGQIVDGDTPWTTERLYLKNAGAVSATATVIFIL